MPQPRSHTAPPSCSPSPACGRGEWNVIRLVNDRRRADAKFGTPGQIPVVFDGQGVAPPHHETTISDGYVGRCAP